MSDVALGVKFVFAVNATFNTARTDSFNDGWYSFEEVVAAFLLLKTVVELGGDFFKTSLKSMLGAHGDLIAHQ